MGALSAQDAEACLLRKIPGHSRCAEAASIAGARARALSEARPLGPELAEVPDIRHDLRSKNAQSWRVSFWWPSPWSCQERQGRRGSLGQLSVVTLYCGH